MAGWWFDHSSTGDVALLSSVLRSANPNAVLAFNDGQKVPLKNNHPGYEDFTFGDSAPHSSVHEHSLRTSTAVARIQSTGPLMWASAGGSRLTTYLWARATPEEVYIYIVRPYE